MIFLLINIMSKIFLIYPTYYLIIISKFFYFFSLILLLQFKIDKNYNFFFIFFIFL